jgi:hypothetical protein
VRVRVGVAIVLGASRSAACGSCSPGGPMSCRGNRVSRCSALLISMHQPSDVGDRTSRPCRSALDHRQRRGQHAATVRALPASGQRSTRLRSGGFCRLRPHTPEPTYLAPAPVVAQPSSPMLPVLSAARQGLGLFIISLRRPIVLHSGSRRPKHGIRPTDASLHRSWLQACSGVGLPLEALSDALDHAPATSGGRSGRHSLSSPMYSR